jgi:trehalose 6-phosphate synthase
MCVTPLKDGMNLVAKEFVTVQDAGDDAGVLLLSEFTGASQEFADDALLCNPFDVESLAALMAQALRFDLDDRPTASDGWPLASTSTTCSNGCSPN